MSLIHALVVLAFPLRRFHQLILRRVDGRKVRVVFSFRKWGDSNEFTNKVADTLSEIASLRTTSRTETTSDARLSPETSLGVRGRSMRLSLMRDLASEAASWFVAGLLLSLLVTWLAQTRIGTEWRGQSAILQDAWDTFLSPGRNLHGAFFPFPSDPKQLADFSISPEKAPMCSVIAFWAIVSALAGAIASSAKPHHSRSRSTNPIRRVIEAALKWTASRLDQPQQKWAFAKWAIVLVLTLVAALMGRSVIFQHANEIRTESNQGPRPRPFNPFYFNSSTNVQRDPNAVKMERVNQLIKEGIELDRNRKHYPAQQKYEQALGVLLQFRPRVHRDVAQIHNMWARSLSLHGWYSRSAEHYRLAIPILVAVGLDDSEQSAMVRNNYAQVLEELGELEKAEDQYQQAIELSVQRGRRRKPETAVVYLNLANFYDKQGKHWQARAQHDLAIRGLVSQPPGSWDAEKSKCLIASSTNLLALHRWGEAFGHADTAFEISDRLPLIDGVLTGVNASIIIRVVAMRCFFLLILFSIALPIAWHATRRGYSLPIWLLSNCISVFPLTNLAVLASVPHRSRRQRRQDLRSKLSKTMGVAIKSANPPSHPPSPPSETTGDATTT
ncbi:MAG: tetratricopeptide repeat protein [Planctomycetales bacterium]|nr:tetratricopeptide repeat protein [Planctomycetales bacterium]